MKIDDPAVLGDRPDPIEQPTDLFGKQGRRRLIENEHLRVSDERLCDLDQLPLGKAERADRAAGIDPAEPELDESGFRHSLLRTNIDAPGGDMGLDAIEQIGGHGVIADETELLEDGDDAGLASICRGAKRHRFTIEQELPAVGSHCAGKYLHKRALPAPFSPISAWTSPRTEVRLAPLRA